MLANHIDILRRKGGAMDFMACNGHTTHYFDNVRSLKEAKEELARRLGPSRVGFMRFYRWSRLG